MATEAARFFNVWLVQSNMVYRAVPYSVVCDWIQEGRLTGRDCVRTADEKNWRYIDEHELFKAYLSMPEATPRAEDDADALADVDMDFTLKKEEEGDEDPDMIPLIDISMVLLVFFMMSADLITQSPVDSPKSPVANMSDNKTAIMVNMKRDADNAKKIIYYFGDDFKTEMSDDALAEKVQDVCRDRGNVGQVVIIRADGNLSYEKVAEMTSKLQNKVPIGTRIEAQVKLDAAAAGGAKP